MVKLLCAIAGGAGSAFSVQVDETDSVDDLKNAIKEANSVHLKNVDANNLQLFFVRKESDAALPHTIPRHPKRLQRWAALNEMTRQKNRNETKQEEKQQKECLTRLDALHTSDIAGCTPLPEGQKLRDVGLAGDQLVKICKEEEKAGKENVHVLVVVAKGAGDDEALVNELIQQKNRDGNASSQDANRKRQKMDIDSFVPYSSLSWDDFERILPVEVFNLQAKTVPDEAVDQLHARLAQLRKLYGNCIFVARRRMYIAAVVEAVCLLLGDVTILVDQDVIGKSVRVHSHFDFVLKRGNKRVSIVEAQRDNLSQALAQTVAGLEALCAVEGLEPAFGIATSYLRWVFVSDDIETIQWTDRTLASMPTKESLEKILGMVYTMLS